MILTEGQQRALDMVKAISVPDWDVEPQYAIITGYAGTGKTTLLKVVDAELGRPLILTPTGKAALRVQEATGVRAQTIHKWLYQPRTDPNTGEVKWIKKPSDLVELPGNRLVVVDEASMVGEEIWADLWATARCLGLNVVLVGDRFQLGPVARPGEHFSALTDLPTEHRTDLTEVVRQAAESPIIRASMMLRESQNATIDAVSDVLESVRPRDFVREGAAVVAAGGVVIAYTNATRQRLNNEIREAMGRTGEELQPTEPLLVLKNNYAIDRFNGEVLRFDGWDRLPGDTEACRDRWKNLSFFVRYGVGTVEGESVSLCPEEIFGKTLGMPETTLARSSRYYMRGVFGYEDREEPSHLNANLGYCLTCHKSQGSEWDDVLVGIEPSLKWMDLPGRRWLYTAVTRSKSRVRVCFI